MSLLNIRRRVILFRESLCNVYVCLTSQDFLTSGVARLKLAKWYNGVEKFGYDGFNKVIEMFENHNETIVNYFENRLTNASAESFNAKIKAFRAQFRCVEDIKFFMYRLATIYS